MVNELREKSIVPFSLSYLSIPLSEDLSEAELMEGLEYNGFVLDHSLPELATDSLLFVSCPTRFAGPLKNYFGECVVVGESEPDRIEVTRVYTFSMNKSNFADEVKRNAEGQGYVVSILDPTQDPKSSTGVPFQMDREMFSKAKEVADVPKEDRARALFDCLNSFLKYKGNDGTYKNSTCYYKR